MKNKVYIFTENNVKCITNPPDLAVYKDNPRALINPDVSHLSKVKRHFWKISNGKIVEMSRPEKFLRGRDIDIRGVDNNVEIKPFHGARAHYYQYLPIYTALAGSVLGFFIKWLM